MSERMAKRHSSVYEMGSTRCRFDFKTTNKPNFMKQVYSFIGKNIIIIAALVAIAVLVAYNWHMYSSGQFGQ